MANVELIAIMFIITFNAIFSTRKNYFLQIRKIYLDFLWYFPHLYFVCHKKIIEMNHKADAIPCLKED